MNEIDQRSPDIPSDRLMAETRLGSVRARMQEAEAAYYQHDDPIISDYQVLLGGVLLGRVRIKMDPWSRDPLAIFNSGKEMEHG